MAANLNGDKYKYSVAEVALELHSAATGNRDIKPLDVVLHYEWLAGRVKIWVPSIHKTYRSQLFDVAILQLCMSALAESETAYLLASKKRNNGNGNQKK